MFQGKCSKAAALAAAIFVGAVAKPTESMSQARGGELRSLSMYPASQALSADPRYKWSAAVQRTDPTGTYYASAVLIAPNLFITAGHVTPRDGSTLASLNELVFGENYNTSTERYEIESTMRFPGYVFGDTGTIDFGIGWTKDFVAGFDTPVQFGSPLDGMTLANVEYGNYGDITTGELPSLGDRLAGRAPVDNGGLGSYATSGAYISTYFPSVPNGDPLNIRTLGFGSGSPWYTSEGELAALSVATTNGFGGGFTIALNLTDSRIQSFLQPHIEKSWADYNATIPEPSSLALLAITVGAGACKRSRRLV